MTDLILNPDVGYCKLNGRLYFLDIGRDRYFKITPALEGAVEFLSEGKIITVELRRDLVAIGLLVPVSAKRKFTSSRGPSLPRTAVGKRSSAKPRLWSGLLGIPRAFLFLALFHLAVGRLGLKKCLSLRTVRSCQSCEDALPSKLEAVLSPFFRASRFFSRRDKCLPDALALRAYLARSGVKAAIVFGIQADPFLAHCWVQHGDTVIGQELEAVRPFHPIMAVS
ncbi:lasso peptide biosynthesis B2 protein [Novosphingobium barchaimii]|uniref:lasso peptide biosynthesis B2 protein n=1 Tax=Novosphingobium barchaimii TaxID=1420591 RepID=UPI00146FEBBA|nr:lasso peptide biosynthesis B2 protein [Novosphingobium barchaimii]